MSTDERTQEIQRLNDEACPVVKSLDQIGTMWRLHVLHALQTGEKRFNELKRSTGARSKTLSDVLDALIDHGLVDRRMEEDAPVAVYYSLTEKGQALGPVLDELADWGTEWVDEVNGKPPSAGVQMLGERA